MTIQETPAGPGDPVREPPRSKPSGSRGRLPDWRPVLGLAVTAVAIVAIAGTLVLVKASPPAPTTVAGGSSSASPTEPTPTTSIPPGAEPAPTWAGGSSSTSPDEPTPTEQATPTGRPTPTPSGGNVFISTGPLETRQTGASMTRLNDGRVLVAGGYESWGIEVATAEVYDPTTGKFAATGSMAEARSGHTATLLKDGRVLIAGGVYQPDYTMTQVLQTAEVYDPKTGRFSYVGSMLDRRVGHTATLLANGRVLIAGGTIPPAGDDGTHEVTLASAELFDPTTNSFSKTGSMTAARTGHAAALLPDGRVLVAGGNFTRVIENGELMVGLASAELYDPASGRFTATGSMRIKREVPVVATLSDGQPVIVGGSIGGTEYNPDASDPVEVYEPANGTFKTLIEKGPIGAAAAVTLLDNRVLVVGVFGPNDLILDPQKPALSKAGRGDQGASGGERAVLLTNGDVLICGSDPSGGQVTLIYRP